MYVVLHLFDDLDDKEKVLGIESYHRYNVGDEYPRGGYTPTAERIKSLLTNDNARKMPLIGIPVDEETQKRLEAKENAVKAEQEAPKAEQETEKTSASARKKTPAAAKRKTARRTTKKE